MNNEKLKLNTKAKVAAGVIAVSTAIGFGLNSTNPEKNDNKVEVNNRLAEEQTDAQKNKIRESGSFTEDRDGNVTQLPIDHDIVAEVPAEPLEGMIPTREAYTDNSGTFPDVSIAPNDNGAGTIVREP